MRFVEIMRLVLINIIENKFKMLLTSLGIIVGSATIVLVIAIGQGGKADVAEQFKNLNAGAIDVSVGTGINPMMGLMPDMGVVFTMPGGGSGGGNFTFGGGGGGTAVNRGSGGNQGPGGATGAARSSTAIRGGMSNTRLSINDTSDIKQLVQGLDEVTLLQDDETAIFGGSLEEEKTVTLVGVYPEYSRVSNLSLFFGRFIEEGDQGEYCVVIGYELALELFTYPAYAVGDYLEIENKTYEIVGVLAQMGSVASGISPDQAVYMPYETASKYVFGATTSPKIAAVAMKVDDVPRIMTDIETVLNENYPNSSFTVTDAGSAKEVASNSANTLSLMLFAVATIVFIVGGIGIMNVMFVSVKERTSEIGILKAVGCSKSTILLEFLMEAAIISVFGGLIGIGVGVAVMPLLKLFDLRADQSAYGLILALVFAIVTGTVFGFYPAWKASRLVPIEALDAE